MKSRGCVTINVTVRRGAERSETEVLRCQQTGQQVVWGYNHSVNRRPVGIVRPCYMLI
jgi:hypothetical protein